MDANQRCVDCAADNAPGQTGRESSSLSTPLEKRGTAYRNRKQRGERRAPPGDPEAQRARSGAYYAQNRERVIARVKAARRS